MADRSRLWVGTCPENSSSFNRLTSACFISLNRVKICHALSLLPSPANLQYSLVSSRCVLSEREVQVGAPVDSGVKTVVRTQREVRDWACCTPRPRGLPVAFDRVPSEAGLLQALPCAVAWDPQLFSASPSPLHTFHPSGQQCWASPPLGPCSLPPLWTSLGG